MTVQPIPRGKALKAGQELTRRYTITGWVGEGGMQDVYLASDDAFDRTVCVKAPKNAAAERRFQRSAKIAAQVNHPNVAKTLDFLDLGGSFFLVEEYIDGRDLKRVRESLPILDPYMAAHVSHHIAKGVAASHRAGVIHRDLKPSNIMVPHGYDFSSVKVTDFGIATMAEAELAQIDDETITGSGTMAGALPYMAPEMLKGARFAEKPADVWAVGAMMFELLIGEKPFGKNFDAVDRIKKADVPPLGPQNVQFRSIAEELYALVRECLVADASARPTADALVLKLSSLCYPLGGRIVGEVIDIKYRSQYFVATDEGTVFFHSESIYGRRPAVGEKVCMTVHPGSPFKRAHPVVALK